jgi:hypothetical protein
LKGYFIGNIIIIQHANFIFTGVHPKAGLPNVRRRTSYGGEQTENIGDLLLKITNYIIFKDGSFSEAIG